jgi:hypothetical protein
MCLQQQQSSMQLRLLVRQHPRWMCLRQQQSSMQLRLLVRQSRPLLRLLVHQSRLLLEGRKAR